MSFDPFNRACPSRSVLDTIADRWALLIVRALADGPSRFSTLRDRVDGISQRMLSVTLRELARDGILTRVEHPARHVEYRLTEIGWSLSSAARGLIEWSQENAAVVTAARKEAS